MIDENTRNAREFSKPLTEKEWKLLEDGMRKLAPSAYPGCDGSCQQAAGSETDFSSITRLVAHCREDENREFARRLYARMAPEERG